MSDKKTHYLVDPGSCLERRTVRMRRVAAKDSGGGMNLQTATQMAARIVMTAALGMKVRTVTIQSQKKERRTKKESTR